MVSSLTHSLSLSLSLSLSSFPLMLVLSRVPLYRVLSALAHWAAIFGETEYLPLVAFPFVKLFQNNPLLCFEVVATVIGTYSTYYLTKTLRLYYLVAFKYCRHDGGVVGIRVQRRVFKGAGGLSVCAVNWCQHWFEYFPNPPLNVLSMAENVLAHHDQELLQHLVDRGITSQVPPPPPAISAMLLRLEVRPYVLALREFYIYI